MLGMKKKNTGVGLVLALVMAFKVQAHIALWDPAMYGYVPLYWLDYRLKTRLTA
jgi:hypothetical protein